MLKVAFERTLTCFQACRLTMSRHHKAGRHWVAIRVSQGSRFISEVQFITLQDDSFAPDWNSRPMPMLQQPTEIQHEPNIVSCRSDHSLTRFRNNSACMLSSLHNCSHYLPSLEMSRGTSSPVSWRSGRSTCSAEQLWRLLIQRSKREIPLKGATQKDHNVVSLGELKSI